MNSSERDIAAPETMQPPETSDETADAAPAVDVVDEFRRRRDLAVGPDRPGAIVEVEVGDDVGQVDIGRPIGVDRADVAPVDVRLLVGERTQEREK